MSTSSAIRVKITDFVFFPPAPIFERQAGPYEGIFAEITQRKRTDELALRETE